MGHVPLVIAGPGAPAGAKVEEIAENIDICPTFTKLAGVSPPAESSGHSLAPLIRGEKPAVWRKTVLIERHGPVEAPLDPDLPAYRSGNPPSYEALRSQTALYVEYAGGEKEYHDLINDPNELRNSYAALSAERKTKLGEILAGVQNCGNAKNCWEAQGKEIGP
ncbi:MAG: sulfatase/phosphatase domain-containing protein [Methylomonas sp.]|jgi:arylsulfatase A-like enzyme